METLAKVLLEHSFFQDFPKPYVDLITGCASNVRFDAGQFIFREGEEASNFYLIRQGRVALQTVSERRGALTVLTLGASEILGWSWLFPRTAGSSAPARWNRRAFWPSMASACGARPRRTTIWATNC